MLFFNHLALAAFVMVIPLRIIGAKITKDFQPSKRAYNLRCSAFVLVCFVWQIPIVRSIGRGDMLG